MNLSFRGACSSPIRKLLCSAAAAGAAALLAACGSPVGSGVAPQYLIVTAPAPATVAPLQTVQLYQCLTASIGAQLYFSNGTNGVFTSRVVWSSSNTGAVEVSNGNIPIPGGTTNYPAGTLIGVGPGNSVITANYDGIIASVPVSVSTPQNIRVKAILYGDYIPLNTLNDVGGSSGSSSSSSSGGGSSSGGSSSGTSVFINNESGTFTIGQGTSVQLAATALLNGVETDVSAYALFGFQVPNPGVAIFKPNATTTATTAAPSNSSTLEGINPGGPLVPEVSFPPCALTNIRDNNIVSFYVSRVQGISVLPVSLLPGGSSSSSSSSSSSGGSSSGSSSGTSLPQLIVGNTQEFQVVATLAPTPVNKGPILQDVSAQSTLISSSPTIADFVGTPGTAGNNILHALIGGGPVFISATYVNGGEAFTSGTVQTSTRKLILSQIETCWSPLNQSCTPDLTNPQPTPSVQAGCLTTTVQFHAYGAYEGQDALQEITRQTTWSSTNTSVATISNNLVTAGQVTGIARTGGSVIIEGLDSTALNIPQAFDGLMVAPIPQSVIDPTPCP
jgi:uncharacterized membrane protein YgcG